AAKPNPIPKDQIGAVAGKQYSGDGLAVAATPRGAQLRCVFQKMEGEPTREGLWLTSTVEGAKGDKFRVVASALERGSYRNLSPVPRTGTLEVEDRLA